ncbi:alpha/beta fold hydrolase [Phycobacter azelaicus]|uniref:alpha/beta fold hydrolase n=1 Tax=Phycobacter azelaicus TaxID=2668075 RepID=UPI0018694668|nr:alpha/beta hydrolase [Phycobacter azelaicus]MBE1295898.1 alpha/beta fold hydrolase [Paracoccaceae bacterium]
MTPQIETGTAEVNGQSIAYTRQGSGPAVLLLHGFPQTKAMWREVALALSQAFTIVTADLRGYGDSSKPECVEAMSFRNMGADQVALMRWLGHSRFHLVGHDRGARTAHRIALDSPEAVASLTLMDIIPTHLLLSELRQEVARAYYHWFFLAQPAPFPEGMIAANPDGYFESCLLGWGGATLEDFPPEALSAYRKSWRNPACIHTMCNDYRAAIDVDFALDAADLNRQVTCPALVLYGATGAMAKHYDVEATWAPRLADMRAATIPGGHFFVDEHPDKTAEALLAFLKELPAL